jgi:Sel1 repeat
VRAAQRGAPAAAQAHLHPAAPVRAPFAAVGAILARSRQAPLPVAPKQPWHSMPLYAAASVAAVLLLIAVIAASQPRFRLGADNPSLPTRYGANLGAGPRTANRPVMPATIAPAVRTFFHDPAIDRAPTPIAVAAQPPVSVAIATAPVACSTPAVVTEAAALVTTHPQPVEMAAMPAQSSGALIVMPLPFAPSRASSIANPGPFAAAIRVSAAARVAPVAGDPIAPALDRGPEGDRPPSKDASTQIAMAQIGALPAPTIATVRPGEPGVEAQVAAALDARAKAGDPIAEFRLGILYAVGQGVPRDYARAASLLRASAESGFADAQYDYGTLCDKGLGVARDAAEAARWYAKAAQQGHAPAALNLGYAYARGVGVVRNLSEAARWFRLAAGAGQVNAQFNLAYMYEQGAGVAKSQIEAYAWYSVAAAKGDRESQQGMARIAARLAPHEMQLAATRSDVIKRSIAVPN